MQKTLAVFVLALFLVSLVPVALAQEDTTVRGKAQERIQERQEQRDARQATRENSMDKRDDRGNAVSTAVRARIQEHKTSFTAFRAQLKDCKGQRTPACEQLRKDVRNRAKVYLKDVVQNVLVTLKEKRAQAAGNATATDTQELDATIADAETAQTTVDALPDDASATQVQTATQNVQDKVKRAQHAIKVHNARHANAGVHGVINRAEHLEKKLDNVLARLKEKGVDTSAADTAVASFKEHIAKARTSADTAQAKLTEARANPDNAEALITEGRAALALARDELRAAHTALKNAVTAIKVLKNGTETLAEETSQPDTDANADVAENETATA